jgi:hypothetical protein
VLIISSTSDFPNRCRTSSRALLKGLFGPTPPGKMIAPVSGPKEELARALA